MIQSHKEGDVVKGKVIRKIKGGLLVNIGVNVFLPASQVDIRRPPDIGMYIDREIECVILKIDEQRRNIVVSRRKLIEDKREKMKQALLSEIVRASFARERQEHRRLRRVRRPGRHRRFAPHHRHELGPHQPSVGTGQDRRRDRGDDPQRRPRQGKDRAGPQAEIPQPLGTRQREVPGGDEGQGEVVNVMSYGAFVKLKDGIEGLVHISEMSWTKRINHPSELVNIGDEVEVVVLGINQDKQEISLGMKQTQPNPWEKVAEKYPPGSRVKGTVRNLTNYGAFIELEEGSTACCT